ncbi:hypothetical protein GURASL_00650 [Geotalea uraniireducens]|uniref:L,D-transpeptidase n=1 Tax=Geotalea uraniireducens TaxID=351604 RepID=A0ABM8EFH6_9BACT|nr:L,D-transpeptidase family protein [Geotalea uraniireducens]BDV41142.1 hypothetical protein GURASL_00650 [Geotalea uraniireducens]
MGKPTAPFPILTDNDMTQRTIFPWCTIFALTALLVARPCAGAEFRLGSGMIGTLASHEIRQGESLIELAPQYDLGYNEIVAANQELDPIIPEPGARITIPSRWIIPDVPLRRGIVINLSEMRLFYFPSRHPDRVVTYPIGIGDEGWETPTGTYRIVEKITRPTWHVPASIRRQKPELPKEVPPGPDNPLGSHALRLSLRSVLIHGTDRPFGIGRQVSHGCIHLYPNDIPKLFAAVPVGTKVSIIRQPVKLALLNGHVFAEAHGGPDDDLMATAFGLVFSKGLADRVDLQKLTVVAREKTGIPTDVSR